MSENARLGDRKNAAPRTIPTEEGENCAERESQKRIGLGVGQRILGPGAIIQRLVQTVLDEVERPSGPDGRN